MSMKPIPAGLTKQLILRYVWSLELMLEWAKSLGEEGREHAVEIAGWAKNLTGALEELLRKNQTRAGD